MFQHFASCRSAEALVRWGWKIKYLLIAYFHQNNQNRFVYTRVIARQSSDIFETLQICPYLYRFRDTGRHLGLLNFYLSHLYLYLSTGRPLGLIPWNFSSYAIIQRWLLNDQSSYFHKTPAIRRWDRRDCSPTISRAARCAALLGWSAIKRTSTEVSLYSGKDKEVRQHSMQLIVTFAVSLSFSWHTDK